MDSRLIATIPLAVEWALLATTVAPLWLADNPRMWRRPRVALGLWFFALLSSAASLGFAIIMTLFSTVNLWIALQFRDPTTVGWFESLLVSFAAYGFLAVGGVVLSIINLKLEPLVRSSDEIKRGFSQVATFHMLFQGRSVQLIALPVHLAFTAKIVEPESNQKRAAIFVSSKTLETLSSEQLNAVLWHELGHIQGRHGALKKVARLANLLTPGLVASRVLLAEVDLLTELAADRYALHYCARADLVASLEFFANDSNPLAQERLTGQRLLEKQV